MAKEKELLVIKYYMESRILNQGRAALWGVITPWRNKNGEWVAECTPVPQNVAHEIIRQHGLKEAQSNKHGTIWDTPSKAFQHKWEGLIEIPAAIGSEAYEEFSNALNEKKAYERKFGIRL